MVPCKRNARLSCDRQDEWKRTAGSHFEEAGRLAAHYSSAKGQNSIEVDYVQRKHVKKPGGSKPGFVVYYTNYSMVIDPDISAIRQA